MKQLKPSFSQLLNIYLLAKARLDHDQSGNPKIAEDFRKAEDSLDSFFEEPSLTTLYSQAEA